MSQAAVCHNRSVALPALGAKVFSTGEDLAWTLSSMLFGAVLGLSQPHFGVWFVAWFGLVPLILLSISSRRMSQSAMRGFLFGTAYNLVALNWFLYLNPPWWVKTEATEELKALGVVIWLLAGVIQGTAYALLSCVTRFLTESKRFDSIKALVALPFVWVLITHVLYNQPDLLLMPMSVLEYSQYQQTYLIQIASLVGGIGLEFLIAAFNVALAAFILSVAGRKGLFPSAAFASLRGAATWLVAVSLIVLSTAVWGAWRVGAWQGAAAAGRTTNVSVVQGNFTRIYNNERRKQGLSAEEVWNYCRHEVSKCPQGIVVFTETLLPATALASRKICDDLEGTAKARGCDLIVGAWEKTPQGETYNSVFNVSPSSGLNRTGYRKRYLMPFGEFEPLALRCLPDNIKRALYVQRRPQICRGVRALGLPTRSGSVAAIVCGESFNSFLCAGSISNDTNMIANLSNLTWFEGSSLGDLVAALSVIRAVENERPFVYSCETGPSFIVDPYGRILGASEWSKDQVVSSAVPLCSGLTPYTAACQLLGRSPFFAQ